MSMNTPPSSGGSKPNAFIGWIEAHPAISIIGGLAIALIAGSIFMKGKQPNGQPANGSGATGTGDLSGLRTDANGNPIIYVPTSDSYINEVINKGSYNQYGGQGNVTNNPPPVVPPPPPPRHGHDHDHSHDHDGGPVVKPPHIVRRGHGGGMSPPLIPPTPPHLYGPGHMSPPYIGPHPVPLVPAHGLGSPVHNPVPMPPVKPPHIVKSGDSIYGIAHQNGTSWHAIYTQNKGVIDSGAAQSGHLHPGGPWENLVPGTALSIPA